MFDSFRLVAHSLENLCLANIFDINMPSSFTAVGSFLFGLCVYSISNSVTMWEYEDAIAYIHFAGKTLCLAMRSGS